MAKIRLLFASAFICLSLFIASLVAVCTCISTNAYNYNLDEYIKEVFYDECYDVANSCAYMLHGKTFTEGTQQILDYYDYSWYSIRIHKHYATTVTSDGYTNNVICSLKKNYTILDHLSPTYYLRESGSKSITFHVSIPETEQLKYTKLWNNRYNFITSAIIFGNLFIASMIMFTIFSKKAHALKSPNFINKLPFYMYLSIGILTTSLLILVLYLCNKATFDSFYLYSPVILIPLLLLALFFTTFSAGIARRYIEGRIYTELFVYTIGKKYGYTAQALVLSLYIVIFPIIFIPLWILHLINIHRLNQMMNSYCEGDWSTYTTSEPILLGGISNNFYKLSASMQATVEKSVRDERTKTELITNVSHDIKTPLTSIINYTELLKNENISDEQREEYLSVLSKNSSRMKKLIDDLIEASKAATGNIELHPIECSIDTLLSQAIVEREPDAALRNLKFVLIKKRESVIMTIDGEKLYRVFDNLLSNAIKYSLSGSRIYVDLSNEDMINISFKNITEDQITISPEELTERFVKGDMSRNSEGSGLGLAICKNLVELMGGTIKLEIDGDQFIVRLTFPLN